MPAFFVIVLLVLTVGQSIAAPFRNLGFDEAITNNIRYLPLDPFEPDAGIGAPGELLPGWDLLIEPSTPVSVVAYNVHSLGRPGVPDNYFSIISREINPYVEGSFSLFMFAATAPLVLSQEADIPNEVKFLTFKSFGDLIGVWIDGNFIFPAFDPIQNIASVDISSYAGREVRIGFAGLSGGAYMDSIAFVVPEPTSYALFGVGALVFLLPAIRRRITKS